MLGNIWNIVIKILDEEKCIFCELKKEEVKEEEEEDNKAISTDRK